MADDAARHLGQSYDALSQSVERLSSGLRINSASDDAAGLAVSELTKSDISQLQQASRNAQDGVSMLQTSDGAMGVVNDLLTRMTELAEQASTGSYSDTQRQTMNSEFGQLSQEITRISGSTEFNGISLLQADADPTKNTINFHVGSGDISFTRQSMDATSLGVSAAADSTADFTSTASVAATSDMFISAAALDTTPSMAFTVGDGSGGTTSYTVDLSAFNTANGGGAGATLDDVVNAMNNTLAGTDLVASAQLDSASGKYVLALNGTAADAGAGHDVTFGAAPAGLTAADFTGTQAGAGGVDLSTQDGASNALTTITNATNTVDSYRAELGYMMNRLDSASQVLDIQSENLQSAESRISDVDVSTEMATMTQNQVLAQAGISMLTQANQMPQMALQLLKS